MIVITYGQIILFGVLVIIGFIIGNFVKHRLEIRRLNDTDEQPRNEVKQQFWILNKMYKKLLADDRKKADFLLEVVRQQIDLMLKYSAEKRKPKILPVKDGG